MTKIKMHSFFDTVYIQRPEFFGDTCSERGAKIMVLTFDYHSAYSVLNFCVHL